MSCCRLSGVSAYFWRILVCWILYHFGFDTTYAQMKNKKELRGNNSKILVAFCFTVLFPTNFSVYPLFCPYWGRWPKLSHMQKLLLLIFSSFIPTSRPKYQSWGSNPCLKAQIPALRPKSLFRGQNPSLKEEEEKFLHMWKHRSSAPSGPLPKNAYL